MGTSAKGIKIGLISLGCDKNRVDAEKMYNRIANEREGY